jgi:O-6-methylguanine DNA methyltransferase
MQASFKDTVYKFTRKIPKGKVATYGQLAKLAGNPKAGRAVGMFMRTNPDSPHTPCHRVVASDGSLTGYSRKGGIKTKKQILISEGVKFKNDKVDLKLSQAIINP